MKPETWIAIYTAIVGSGALLLNFKNWLDSGVKLRLSVISDGMVIGGGPELDERDLIILNVVNRGDASTQISSMIILEITSWWQLRTLRPKSSYVVTNPQLKGRPQNVPGEVKPGKKWAGVIRQRSDIISDMRTGNFYTGVYLHNCS
jgi:hypothetical protein